MDLRQLSKIQEVTKLSVPKQVLIDFAEIRAKKLKVCIFCNCILKNPLFFRNQFLCSDCYKKIRSLYTEGYFK